MRRIFTTHLTVNLNKRDKEQIQTELVFRSRFVFLCHRSQIFLIPLLHFCFFKNQVEKQNSSISIHFPSHGAFTSCVKKYILHVHTRTHHRLERQTNGSTPRKKKRTKRERGPMPNVHPTAGRSFAFLDARPFASRRRRITKNGRSFHSK